MIIPEDQVERIREATNIVDLIGEHVKLKKRGRNFTGLCPFHNEKTPSFSVQEDKGIFKCFGCGKGGDVFSFVMQMEALTFPEAIKRLADRAHIEIASVESDAELAARNQRDSLYDVLKAAATWYFRTLRLPEGTAAMEYLAGRGLEREIIRRFGLGFAPERSGSLIKALTEQGYQPESLEAAGLTAHSNGRDYYERFRGRVMFPVFSATGRIVGFGGRILPNGPKDIAKYINSPDTAVYHKSNILYGLFQAKDAIRKKDYAILVEGYADVLAVFQAGIENVVAASGTSLTADQLALLKRYTSNIVLLFDADTAGKNAAIRGIELAIEAGFNVDTVVLPAGEDPDSYIRQKGRDAFEAALEHRQSWIETKAQWFEEHGAFRDPGRMAPAIRAIVETIAKVPDAIKRPLFIRKLSEKFQLSEQMLTMELQKFLNSAPKYSPPIAKTTTEEQGPHYHDDQWPDDADRMEGDDEGFTSQEITKPETALLEAAIADPTEVVRLFDDTQFDIQSIPHPHVQEILGYIVQRVMDDDPPTIEQLLANYREHPEHERLLIAHGMTEFTMSDAWDESLASARSAAVHQAQDAIAGLSSSRADVALSNTQRLLKGEMSEDEERKLLLEATANARARLKVPRANHVDQHTAIE